MKNLTLMITTLIGTSSCCPILGQCPPELGTCVVGAQKRYTYVYQDVWKVVDNEDNRVVLIRLDKYNSGRMSYRLKEFNENYIKVSCQISKDMIQ